MRAMGNAFEDPSFNYRLLSRMMSDCDYYINTKSKNQKLLWAGSIDGQINAMISVWKSLPEKPEWCSLEDIMEYKKKMKV